MARTLEDLAALDFEALGELYRKAKFPGKVEGDCRGRMLATNPNSHMSGLWKALEGIAGESWFPWQGKSFEDGAGINRITPLQFKLFKFETREEPSLEDGKPALLLDYDQPGNPFIIKRVRDEVRQIAPGLLLGQMYVVTTEPRLTLYFGLELPG
jgi:hypothetical protein